MRRLPETLNESEIKALLSQPNKRARTGSRELAIIRLMLNAGLRASDGNSQKWSTNME
jgi:site-specific recombinase XerD